MTAVHAPATPATPAAPAPARAGQLRAAARLLRIEMRRNAMPWLVPVAVALFWLTAYRKIAVLPPLWNLRAAALQTSTLVVFAAPVAGVAAWMGSRDRRRRTTDLVQITPRPRWARLLACWAATTLWAEGGYLACLAAGYGVTAARATGGGPLWWPAAVVAASLPALAALGFAAGTLVPSRLTPPLAAIGVFFALVLSTELIHGSQSYWQVSPLVSGPWDDAQDAGVATFYHYLPDLAIAQITFLAGLTAAVLGAVVLADGPAGARMPDNSKKRGRFRARGHFRAPTAARLCWLLRRPAVAVTMAGLAAAGTAVALAGTGQMNDHGMIAIPALHDAASDRPVGYAPACSRTAIPVCLNPVYASYLQATATALAPLLSEIAGLPGSPARISQAPASYRQGPGNSVAVGLAGPELSGTPPALRLLLPLQLAGPSLTPGEMAAAVRSGTAPQIAAALAGSGRNPSEAQRAVTTALLMAAGLPASRTSLADPWASYEQVGAAPGSPADAAARQLAALPAPARHAWLMRHLAGLRAGRITLAQLP